MIERNAGVPEDSRIDFRVGIHVGDVVEESDGDLMGDGVNIAARLEGVGEARRDLPLRASLPAGQVAARPQGHRSRRNAAQEHRRAGAGLFRGARRPGRIGGRQCGEGHGRRDRRDGCGLAPASPPCCSSWPPARRSAREQSRSPAPVAEQAAIRQPSRSPTSRSSFCPSPICRGDPAQDYFADGITRESHHRSVPHRGAFIIRPNTAFTFKGKPLNVRPIGEELSVRYVLEGSGPARPERESASTCQLTDAETGRQVWGDTFRQVDGRSVRPSGRDRRPTGEYAQGEAGGRYRRTRRAQTECGFDRSPPSRYCLCSTRDSRPRISPRRVSTFSARSTPTRTILTALQGMAGVDSTIAANYQAADRAAKLASVEAALTKVLSLQPDDAERAHAPGPGCEIDTNRGAEGIAELRARAGARSQSGRRSSGARVWPCSSTAAPAKRRRMSRRRFVSRPAIPSLSSGSPIAAAAKLFSGADEEAVALFRRSIELNRNYPMSHLYIWPRRCSCSGGRRRRARRPRSRFSSIRNSPSASFAPTRRATTRLSEAARARHRSLPRRWIFLRDEPDPRESRPQKAKDDVRFGVDTGPTDRHSGRAGLRPEQAFHVPEWRRGGRIAGELPESASQNSFFIPASQKVADPRVSSGAEAVQKGARIPLRVALI